MGIYKSTYLTPFIVINKRKDITYTVETKLCPNCKKEKKENKFCSNCGSKIEIKYVEKIIKASYWDFLKEYESYEDLLIFKDFKDSFCVFPNDETLYKDITYDSLIDLEGLNTKNEINSFKKLEKYKDLFEDLNKYFGVENIQYTYGVINLYE